MTLTGLAVDDRVPLSTQTGRNFNSSAAIEPTHRKWSQPESSHAPGREVLQRACTSPGEDAGRERFIVAIWRID